MVMAEIDTSSYPKPTPGPSALDTFGKLQGLHQQGQQIERTGIGIEKDKLDLVNNRWAVTNRELQGLLGDKDVDFNKVAGRFQNLVNLGLMPPEMMAQSLKDVPTDKAKIPEWLQMRAQQGQHIVDAINYAYGAPGTIDTGQALQPTRVSPKPGFGIRSGEGMPIQKQAPVTTPVVNPDTGQPALLGPQSPQLAPGTAAAPPPVNAPVNPSPLPVGPRRLPDGSTMDVGPNQPPLPVARPPNAVVADRFPNIPRGPATGLAPGVSEAATVTGQASGTQLAGDRAKAANFQREVFPLAQAIPLLEKLGTKGVGPGTETFNNMKSFIVSNVPGIKADDPAFSSVKDFDQLKKYLVDYANTISSTGTNDRLAATFAGNPNVGISQAASIDVAKAALSLRRMQQAQILAFEKTGLTPDKYSQWLAKQTNEFDPRAFGVDMMSDEAKSKLRKQLDKNPKDKAKFEKSLQIAHDLEFVTPQQK